MRINYETKLNFEDVLLQPKRSTLTSRKDVDMTRKFTFRNSGKVMNFTPIFASNMDGVGTFSMAKEMQNLHQKIFEREITFKEIEEVYPVQ